MGDPVNGASAAAAPSGSPGAAAGAASPRYSIVIPVHNEAECLAGEVAELVGGLEARGVDYELILAENGSSDDTPAIADALAAANPRVRALRCPVPDYGAAMKAGMLAGQGELIVNFDIDFHDVEFMLKAGEVLKGATAVSVGARVPAAQQGPARPCRPAPPRASWWAASWSRGPTTADRPRGTSSPSGSPLSYGYCSTVIWTTRTA